MAESSESSYREQLGAILRRRDPEPLRQFLLESAARYGDARQVADVRKKDDEEMLELLHRMILSRPDLQELHRASREWLSRHGVSLPVEQPGPPRGAPARGRGWVGGPRPGSPPPRSGGPRRDGR